MAKTSLHLNVESKSVAKASDNLDDLTRSSKNADNATDRLTKGTKANSKAAALNAKKQKESSASIAKVAVQAFLAAKAIGLLTKSLTGSVQAAATLETLELSFVSITGSAEAASSVMKDLSAFTASTPFQLEGVANAAKQLITAKGSTEGLTGELQKLGDIAATAGVPINELAAIYVKAMNKGKIQAEELNQISERGIPIIRILAEQFGVAKEEIFKMGSEGKLSFEDLSTAFSSMTAEGGLAFGAMERQSESLNGVWSTLKDNVFLAASALGEVVSETLGIKELAKWASEAAKWFQSIHDNAVAAGMIVPKIVQPMQNLVETDKERAEATRGLNNLLDEQAKLTKSIALVEKTRAELMFKFGFEHTEQQKTNLQLLDDISLAQSIKLIDLKEEIELYKEEKISLDSIFESQQEIRIELNEIAKLGDAITDKDRERKAVLEGQLDILNAQRDTAREIAAAAAEAAANPIFGPEPLNYISPLEIDGLSHTEFNKREAARRERENPREKRKKKGRIKSAIKPKELDLDFLHEGHALELALIEDHFSKRHDLIMENQLITDNARTEALLMNERHRSDALKQLEDERMREKLQTTKGFFENIETLGKSFGKRGAKIAKAAAIAQGGIKAYEAYNVAFTDPTPMPLPLRYVSAGLAAAAVVANTAKIANSGNFAQGGILGGPSATGDAVSFNGNRGEVIINFEQQRRLLNLANGGGSGGGNQTGNVTIINKTSAPITGTTRTNSNGEQEITIRAAVNRMKSELTNEAETGSGTTIPALQRNFGLRRTGTS